MGDNPSSRSENSTASDSGVTGRHTRVAGTGVSPSSHDDPPIGGGGALPKRARFGMEAGFKGLSVAAGAMVLVIIVAIAIFLISKAVPAIRADNENFLTFNGWFPNETEPRFGIAVLAFGTVLTSIIALLVAVPIALGIALFLSHYAPKRLATPLGFVIDLLAAVPSVVFGHLGPRRLHGAGPRVLRLAQQILQLDPDLRRRRPVRPFGAARQPGPRDHGAADRHLAVA